MPLRGALEGFFAARNQADQEESSDLKKAAALQSLMANVQASQRAAALRQSLANSGGDVEQAVKMALASGDVAAAHQLSPLLEIKRKADEQKLLAGVDMNDPESLRRLAVTLKKPEFATHAERIDAGRARDAELASMRGGPAQTIQPDVQEVQQAADQGTPAPQAATVAGTPGIFDVPAKSQYPDIAAAAKNYQAQMNSPSARAISPQTWMGYARSLQDRQTALDTRQEPPAQLHTDADGRVWERNRAGKWSLALGPDGKPLSSKGAGVALDDDAMKVAAWEKLLWGTDPKGLGNANAQQRAAVQNERARLGKALNLSDAEMAVLPQDNKVKQKAVDKLTTWGATVGRSAEKLDLDLKVAIDYAQRLPLGQIQLVNKGVINGLKEFNNPDANAYGTAINSVRQEYARLMAGPTSNAMLPVEAMKKGNELLSSGVDVASLKEVGNQMRRDASNTKTATDSQISALRQTMLPKGTPAATGGGPLTPAEQAELDALRARYPRGR